MPKLIRLYVASALLGFALSAVFVAALLWLDVAGLRHLVLATPGGRLGGVMLFVFNGIVFAGVQFGIAVMRLAEPEGGGPPPGRRDAAGPARPVAVAVPARR